MSIKDITTATGDQLLALYPVPKPTDLTLNSKIEYTKQKLETMEKCQAVQLEAKQKRELLEEMGSSVGEVNLKLRLVLHAANRNRYMELVDETFKVTREFTGIYARCGLCSTDAGSFRYGIENVKKGIEIWVSELNEHAMALHSNFAYPANIIERPANHHGICGVSSTQLVHVLELTKEDKEAKLV